MEITTKRLILYSVDIALLDAAIAGVSAVEKLGYKSSGEWPGKDFQEAIPYFRKELLHKGGTRGFDSWIFVDKSTREIFGGIGFLGEPDRRGRVEIGFATNFSQQRKGYCFEAATALIAWAKSQPEVNLIVASCEQKNKASASLLEKLGFRETISYEGLRHWQYLV